MKHKAINTWWQKAIAKEVLRNTNKPKAPKGDRWMTPTNFDNFAPQEGHAR